MVRQYNTAREEVWKDQAEQNNICRWFKETVIKKTTQI